MYQICVRFSHLPLYVQDIVLGLLGGKTTTMAMLRTGLDDRISLQQRIDLQERSIVLVNMDKLGLGDAWSFVGETPTYSAQPGAVKQPVTA